MVHLNAAGRRSIWSPGGLGRLLTLASTSLILASLLIAGCGYDPEEPAYDTAANSDNFPPPALTLLDQIDAGELAGYESIAYAFGQLYTKHTDLLDNAQWKEVVSRLGSKFELRADKFSKAGIGSYTRAAGYYRLASFANPNRPQLARQSALFGAWLEADRDPEINLAPLVDSTQTDMKLLIPSIRQFLLSGSLHRAFFEKYVARTLKERLESSNSLTASTIDSLSETDRALLAAADLATMLNFERTIDFETADGQAEITLVAWRIEKLDSTRYQAEFYWLSRRTIAAEYTARLRLSIADSMRPAFSADAAATTVNMGPLSSMPPWEQGKVAVVGVDFVLYTPPSTIKVGLLDDSKDPIQFLSPSGLDSDFFELDISALTSD